MNSWDPFAGLDPFGSYAQRYDPYTTFRTGVTLPNPSAGPVKRPNTLGLDSELEQVTHADTPNDVWEYLTALKQKQAQPTAPTAPAAPSPLDTEWDRLIALQLQKYGGYDEPTALDLVSKQKAK